MVTPVTSPPSGSSETVAPTGPGSGRRTGGAVGPGAVTREARDPASSRTTSTPASPGWARSQRLARAWSRRGSAERAQHRHARRAPPDGLEERQLRVRLVLVDRGAPDRRCRPPPPRPRARGAASPCRPRAAAGTRPSVRARARPPSAATTTATPASQPGQAASRASRAGTSPSATTSTWRTTRRARAGTPALALVVGVGVGHRRDRTRPAPRRPGPFVYASAVPESPISTPTQRVVDAASRKGVSLDVHVFAESTHTAEEAAAAVGAELGQIVKSLVFVAPRRTGGSSPSCASCRDPTASTSPAWRPSPGSPTCGARPRSRPAT